MRSLGSRRTTRKAWRSRYPVEGVTNGRVSAFCAILTLAAGASTVRCMFDSMIYAVLIFGFPLGILVGYIWRDRISRRRRARYQAERLRADPYMGGPAIDQAKSAARATRGQRHV
jgi:hypothetical protein